MIGRKTEAVLSRAVGFALENDHEYFTLEHVLWALLAEPYAAETLQACGADLGQAGLLKRAPGPTAEAGPRRAGGGRGGVSAARRPA